MFIITLLKDHYGKIAIFLSIFLLFILVWFKGIHINNINNNHQEQFQYQGQLSINLFMSNSDIIWKAKEINSTIEDYCRERSKLPPEQSYFSHREIQFNIFRNKHYLIYPEFKNK